MKFIVEKDCRKFKAGDIFDLDLNENRLLYLVGHNGVGKSTLLQALRAQKDSLKGVNLDIFDGMTDPRIELAGCEPIKIEGFNYDEAFYLDAVLDDPASFINSASAGAFIGGGGMRAQRISRGEKSLVEMEKFRRKIKSYLTDKYGSIEAWKESGKTGLVVLDEVDEGLDMNLQFNFNNIIKKIYITELNCDVICVNHNAICMMSVGYGDKNIVYDIESKSMMSPTLYVIINTGYDMLIKDVLKKEK